MTSRQRGAALVLAALVAGRILDRFELPFEAVPSSPQSGGDSAAAIAVPLHTPVVRDDSHRVAPPHSPVGRDASHRADSTLAINRATAAELVRLPGIGSVLAARIVADRAARGPFRDAADLQRVRGIGPRSAARLAPRLRFD